jgi:hypothetical protein
MKVAIFCDVPWVEVGIDTHHLDGGSKLISIYQTELSYIVKDSYGHILNLLKNKFISQAQKSNLRQRPLGIGIQGLADAFICMRLPFDSEGAQMLNRQIFETIYYGALDASCELAEKDGPYETYEGSPVSKGVCFLCMFIYCNLNVTTN